MSKYRLYLNAFKNVIYARIENKEDKQLLKQNVFFGVKLVNRLGEPRSYDEAANSFQLASAIEQVMGQLTPKEFMNIFPIDKDFKGHKWEMKDYFYTRDYINKLDQDKPIGEEITHFLWKYRNRDTERFVIELMGLMSAIRRFEGKLSLAEEWADKNNIKTLHKDSKGKQYLFDKETGKTVKVRRSRPKHLRLVK